MSEIEAIVWSSVPPTVPGTYWCRRHLAGNEPKMRLVTLRKMVTLHQMDPGLPSDHILVVVTRKSDGEFELEDPAFYSMNGWTWGPRVTGFDD